MTISRRGFFGSILGIVASQNFLVKGLIDPPQRVILPYKMFFRNVLSHEESVLVQAPGVKAIEKIKGGWQFVAENLEAKQTLCMRSVCLYTMDNELVMESKFSSDVPMTSGDVLRCTQALSLDMEDIAKVFAKTPEDLVSLYIKQRKGLLNGGPC